jgi:type VI secretion system protein ImpH
MRRSHVAVADLLFREPYRFDFFQAVRLLERIRVEKRPVGHDAAPADEVVRFAAHVAIDFPASAVYDLDAEKTPPRMVTPFIGLVGPLGALPTIYTENLVGPLRKHRGPVVSFLDLFHHRLVSLFYRAWQKYNLPALWESGGAAREVGSDRFTRHLFDLLGLGLEPLRNRLILPDAALLFYVGLFAQQHRSAAGLETLLGHYFGRPVTILTFTGQWLRLPPSERTRVGARGAYNQLGVDAVAGHKVWDDQSKFRVRVGPLDLATFRDFLPGGTAAGPFMDLVRHYVRSELDFDAQLVLKAEDVPACQLHRGPTAPQLGRTAWLKCRDFPRDADDAVFKPAR